MSTEPNAYKHKFKFEIPPEQASRDFKSLRKIVTKYFPNNIKLVGPDVTRPKNLAYIKMLQQYEMFNSESKPELKGK